MNNINLSQISFCPYVGLQPYTDSDRDYFFGRESDIRIISSNLYAASLTVLYGESGVGKSSVLQAGVLPRLRASPRTSVVIFNRWPDKSFLDTLKAECLESLAAALEKEIQVDSSLPLDEFLAAATNASGNTIIIILDQFEEYFLYHPETEAGKMLDLELAKSINREDIDANFLIALREDALSKLDRFRSCIPNMLGNSLRLRHLDATSARDAIRKPLEVYNKRHSNDPPVIAEDLLVERLIDEIRVGKLLIGQGGRGTVEEVDPAVDSGVRIESPFLQLVLTRLWDAEMHQSSRLLRLATLESLGNAGLIVRTHMDEALKTLSLEEQEAAASVFRYLVTPSGTKIAYTVADLDYYAKSTQALGPVLEKLARGNVRILRPVTSPSEPGVLRYEIYHDVLALAVLDWRVRYETGKELARERVNQGRQIRSLLGWALLGTLTDLISPFLFSVLIGSVFLPVGMLFLIPSLRKVKPPLSLSQILIIILAWFTARILSLFLLDFLSGVVEFSIPFIAIAAIMYFLSGPMGGLFAFWAISRRRENQFVRRL